MKKTLIVFATLTLLFSCKKEEQTQKPNVVVYDDILPKGFYRHEEVNLNSISIGNDTNVMQMAIYPSLNNPITFTLRRWKGQVGYQGSGIKRIMFKSLGNKRWEIVGDTLQGWVFVKII